MHGNIKLEDLLPDTRFDYLDASLLRFNRLLDTHSADVHGFSNSAWLCVCHNDGTGKDCLRRLADTLLDLSNAGLCITSSS